MNGEISAFIECMNLTGIKIESAGRTLTSQGADPVRAQSPLAFMKTSGTTFHEVLRDAQSAVSTFSSNVQSELAASVSNSKTDTDEKNSGGMDALLARAKFSETEESPTLPAFDSSALSKPGASVLHRGGQIAEGTVKSPSGYRSPLDSICQNGNGPILNGARDPVATVDIQPTVVKNQPADGAGKSPRVEQTKHSGEVSTFVEPSITPAPLPAYLPILPNQIQPTPKDSKEQTCRATFQTASDPSATKTSPRVQLASLSSSFSGAPAHVGQALPTDKLSSAAPRKSDFRAQATRIEGSESGSPRSTYPAFSGDQAAVERSAPSSTQGPKVADPTLQSAPAFLHPASSPSESPFLADSALKGSQALAGYQNSHSAEPAKSIEISQEVDSPSAKPHPSIEKSINDAGSSNLTKPTGAGNLDLENQAGVSLRPSQANGIQHATPLTEVGGADDLQAFRPAGDSPVSQPVLAAAKLQPQRLTLSPVSYDAPPGSDLSGTTKSGSLRSDKASAIPGSSSTSSANPIGVASHAVPAETAHPLFEANYQASDQPHTPALNSVTLGVGGHSANGVATLTPAQTFEALDHTSDVPTANWVRAGAQRAEAGFQDPALGWIAVRADQSGGGVHATVLPATAEAAQSLGSQMSGLSAHLAETHASVTSLSLGAGEGREAGTAGGQSFNQGGGQDRQQQNSAPPQITLKSGNSDSPTPNSLTAPSPTAFTKSQNPDAKYISVMA